MMTKRELMQARRWRIVGFEIQHRKGQNTEALRQFEPGHP